MQGAYRIGEGGEHPLLCDPGTEFLSCDPGSELRLTTRISRNVGGDEKRGAKTINGVEKEGAQNPNKYVQQQYVAVLMTLKIRHRCPFHLSLCHDTVMVSGFGFPSWGYFCARKTCHSKRKYKGFFIHQYEDPTVLIFPPRFVSNYDSRSGSPR